MPTPRKIVFSHRLGSAPLGIPEAFWIEARGEEWTTAYRVIAIEGRPVVAEVRIFPTEASAGRMAGEWSRKAEDVPTGGLTTRQLRATPLGSDVATGLKASKRYASVPAFRRALRRAGFERLRKPGRGGRQGWSDDRLLAAAAFYVQRGGRRPVADLADELKISRTQARDMLQAAGERGFLTAGSPGRTSRDLTDKAKALLGLKGEK